MIHEMPFKNSLLSPEIALVLFILLYPSRPSYISSLTELDHSVNQHIE